MTELLYQTDSYLQEFTATVVAVDGQGVALDRTAFYPGGGGQPCDLGTLACVGGSRTAPGTVRPVTKVYRAGDTVWHTVAGEPPAVGSELTGRLDWPRRYGLMRLHTALHILCGVIFHEYGAFVTGGNMEPNGRARMDFEFERMQAELVHEIEAKVNVEVAAARPVDIAILPREEAFQIPDLIRTKINLLPEGIRQVRTVAIAGLDLQADGGTHVANTREVGPIRIVDYMSKGKINKRLIIALAP
ncbi:MAG TPA: alanyl-tRNA editing protein [Anaerolineae bacterium]|nr:alanyl-tRNA editing protein [Anaerolineae bacterium]HOQ98363.1 alanyl-tRNA editing protein [Anaerolineae bacterium]HPL26598.1 alanyl-tRNA editing protein [Anaerolineae bacterium]